ncbi:unnamed protein product [Victoria cruziana]
MEGSGGGGGGGGGSPAPFLIKTYDMVEDASTDAIVSWSTAGQSFVVWNPPEFARVLLPTYFKHSNFSSFIRQLNTYGFHKIDPERWEFANEDFSKDNKHLLKNIHRRKPIHSHSQPLAQPSSGDAERAALEEELQKLRKEKDVLLANIARCRQQQEGLEKLEPRVDEMEQRQIKLLDFLAKAVQSQSFVDNLIRELERKMQVAAINKKRRLPNDCEAVENNSTDGETVQRSLITRPPNVLTWEAENWDHSNKLRLDLSPAASDNLVLASRHGSTEDDGNSRHPQSKVAGGKVISRAESANESLELLDSDTSLAFARDEFSLGKNSSAEELDGHCHLNLTLSSSPLQTGNPGGAIRVFPSVRGTDKEANEKSAVERQSGGNASSATLKEATINNNQASSARVNDVFWEQFLTERPGSSDIEEASSTFRASPCSEQVERNAAQEITWNSKQKMQQLTL